MVALKMIKLVILIAILLLSWKYPIFWIGSVIFSLYLINSYLNNKARVVMEEKIMELYFGNQVGGSYRTTLIPYELAYNYAKQKKAVDFEKLMCRSFEIILLMPEPHIIKIRENSDETTDICIQKHP